MEFIEKDDYCPTSIQNGYLFPSKYQLFGNTNFDLEDFNDLDSEARIFIGTSEQINSLLKKIDYYFSNDADELSESSVVVGIWDNSVNHDLIMLGVFISDINDNPLDFISQDSKAHSLLDSSQSESDAWIAWDNLVSDFKDDTISKEEMEQYSNIFLQNISVDLLDNITKHSDDEIKKFIISNKIKNQLK